jgi:hypothetical protein
MVLEYMIRASIIRAMGKHLGPDALLVDIGEWRKWLSRIEYWMEYGWWTVTQQHNTNIIRNAREHSQPVDAGTHILDRHHRWPGRERKRVTGLPASCLYEATLTSELRRLSARSISTAVACREPRLWCTTVISLMPLVNHCI